MEQGAESRDTLRARSTSRALGPAAVVERLVSRGLLSAGIVVDEGVRVIDKSRRNHNLHVLPTSDAGLVVKQGGTNSIQPGTVAYEAVVYAELQGLYGNELSGRIPRCFGVDPADGSLILELVPASQNVRDHHQELAGTPVHLAKEMGHTLAVLHDLPISRQRLANTRLSRELPEVFAVTLPRFNMLQGTSTGMQDLIRALQNLGGLAESLDGLSRDWRAECVIHGDPRWDNWVIREGSEPAELVLVDWEFAGVGDPGWDVGSLLGEYLAAWVLGTPELPGVTLDQGMSLSRFPLGQQQPAMAALWAAYVKRRRLARPEFELLRAVRCAAAKLIQLAGEQMHHSTELTATTAALLQLADHMFAEPSRAVIDLLGIRHPTGGVGR